MSRARSCNTSRTVRWKPPAYCAARCAVVTNQTRALGSRWYDRVPLELHGHRKKLEYVLDSVEQLRRARDVKVERIAVLEIGCSNGRILTLPLAERGYDVTGIDLHEPSIAQAVADNTLPNARFICRSAEEFIAVQSFDVVVLSDILEHVGDPRRLLGMAARLLNPGGIVLICIPNGFGPAEIERRMLERTGADRVLLRIRGTVNRLRGRERVAYNNDSGHIQRFRRTDIERLIADAGLRIEDCRKGALFGGAVSYPIGNLLPGLVRVSLALADRLPFACVSTWYFRCTAPDGPSAS